MGGPPKQYLGTLQEVLQKRSPGERPREVLEGCRELKPTKGCARLKQARVGFVYPVSVLSLEIFLIFIKVYT